jgi:hypothetical protein
VKIHCSVLAEDAIKGAIADYKAKRQNAAAQVEVAAPSAPQKASGVATQKAAT